MALKSTFSPEYITFVTTISACINTLFFISALGITTLSASVVGITYVSLFVITILSICFFVAWLDKKYHDNQYNIYKTLLNIKNKLKKIPKKTTFPKALLDDLNRLPDNYSWRLSLLIFMCFIADILVFSTLFSTASYFILGAHILKDFSFQLFVVCFGFVTSALLSCFRSHNYETIIENRNTIKSIAKGIIKERCDENKKKPELSLTKREIIIGILVSVIVTVAIFFLITHLFFLVQANVFSANLLNIVFMVDSYIHGYALLASLLIGYLVFRIYQSFILKNPDWQLINSFINVVTTYAVVIIFSQRFLVLLVTLFSIPIAAPQIALANFLIPLIASIASIFHAYSTFTFYSDDRSLNLVAGHIEDVFNKECPSPSFDFTDTSSEKSEISSSNDSEISNKSEHSISSGLR